MAEMLIQSENLTAIADKIRVLSGTEGAMSLDDMEGHVGEANTNVATETDLIAQIASALEGKAAGGSGGSQLETCTVFNNTTNCDCYVQITNNGTIDYCKLSPNAEYSTDNAIKGSIGIIVQNNGWYIDKEYSHGLTVIDEIGEVIIFIVNSDVDLTDTYDFIFG